MSLAWKNIYHFQVLIGSLSAIFTGGLIFIAAKMPIKAEKKRLEEQVEAITAACRAEISANMDKIENIIKVWDEREKSKVKGYTTTSLEISTLETNIIELGKILSHRELVYAYHILSEFKGVITLRNQFTKFLYKDETPKGLQDNAYKALQNKCQKLLVNYPYKGVNGLYI